MQGPGVVPAAPPGMQVQIPEKSGDGGDPAAEAGHGKSPLGKMKNKARKLRDKIKKVTSPGSTPDTHDPADLNKQNQAGDLPSQPPQQQRDDVGGGTDSHEEDEEDDIPEGDQHSVDQGGDAGFQSRSPQFERDAAQGQPDATQTNEEYGPGPAAEDQPKHDQARSFDAVAKPEDGAEGVLHGGTPAATVATGAYGRPQDSKPISPFKNDGPPGALQAAPTEYHYAPEDDKISSDPGYNLSPGQSKPQIEDVTESHLPSSTGTEDTFQQPKPSPSDVSEAYDPSETAAISSLGRPPSAEDDRGVDTSDRLSSDKIPQTDHASPGQMSPTERDMNLPYPEDIVKPNPEFGQSASPTHKKIAVINEDLPAEARADAGLSPDNYSSSQGISDEAVPENAPLTFGMEGKADADALKAAPAGIGLLAGEERPSELPDHDKSSGGYSTSQGVLDRSLPENIDGEETADADESKALPEEFGQQRLGELASTGGYGQGGGEDEPQVRQTVPEPQEEVNELEDPQTIAGESQKTSFTPLAEEMEKPAAGPEALAVDDSVGKQGHSDSSDRAPPSSLAENSPKSDLTTEPYAESGSDSGRAFGADMPEAAAGATAGAAAAAAAAAAAHDEGGSQDRKDDEAGHSMVEDTNKPRGLAIGQDTTDDYAEDRGNEGYSDAASGDGKEQFLGDLATRDGRASIDEENRSKWAADKPDSLKDATTSDHVGVGDASNIVDTVKGASPRGGQEDVGKEAEGEDEYFDPNNVTDNQFQEGFTHGTEEADKKPSSGLFTSSMGKLAGLTGTVGSSLGLSKAAGTDASPTEKSDLTTGSDNFRSPSTGIEDVSHGADNIPSPGTGTETETDRAGIDESDNVPSPSMGSERPEQPWIPQGGVKDAAAAGLGYEGKSSPEPSERTTEPVIPGDTDIKDDTQGNQESSGRGGALQGLSDAFSSKFGYGSQRGGDNVATGTENVDSNLNDQQQTDGAFQGLKNVAATKLGYGGGGSVQDRTADRPPQDEGTFGDQPSQAPVEQQPLPRKEVRSPSAEAGGPTEYPRDVNSEEQPPAPLEEAPSTLEQGQTDSPKVDRNIPEQPQTGGTLQGLMNVAGSKLGYGSSKQDPAIGDSAHDASSGTRPPPISSPEQPPPAPPTEEAKPPGPPGEEQEEGKHSNPPSSYSPSSYAQKFFSTAAAAKDYLWSPKAGTGKQEPAADDAAEVESPASVV